jgi:hypothetical protein
MTRPATRGCCLLAAVCALLGAVNGALASYAFEFSCRSDTVQRVSPGGYAEYYYTLENTGTELDVYEFHCREVQTVPDWFVIYCVGSRCADPSIVLYETLAVGAADTLVHLTVYTSATPGHEIADLRVVSTGNRSLSESINVHTLAGTSIAESRLPGSSLRASFGVVPNPMAKHARIRFSVPAQSGPAWVEPPRFALYDLQGRQRLTFSVPGLGQCEYDWPRPASLPDGVYLLRMVAGEQSVWQKVVLKE